MEAHKMHVWMKKIVLKLEMHVRVLDLRMQ
jgi:hypothetical protein